MQTLTDHNGLFTHGLRVTTLVLLGMAITFGLFVLMARLTEQEQALPPLTPIQILGPIILAIEEPETNDRIRIKPMEKPVIKPPSELPQPDPAPNDTSIGTMEPPSLFSEKIEIKPAFGEGSGDMSATPQFRVDPSYPPEAARDGIEGWVKLGFTVTTSGSVSDIRILDSEPKRVFDSAARRALSKWKYKPKLDNGIPVSQPDLHVLLEFRLNQ